MVWKLLNLHTLLDGLLDDLLDEGWLSPWGQGVSPRDRKDPGRAA